MTCSAGRAPLRFVWVFRGVMIGASFLYVRESIRRTSIKVSLWANRHQTLILFVVGIVLLTFGLTGLSEAQGEGVWIAQRRDMNIRAAVGLLYLLVEGPFGALLATVAGLGAVVASAFGAYKAAVALLVCSVAAFILRSLISLFFGTNYDPGGPGVYAS